MTRNTPQRIYIAGPMTGLPDLNFPAFHAEAAQLRSLGHTVINPAEINADPTTAWETCMRQDINQLITCDRIHMLPGWTASRGAKLEHHIAKALGMLVTLAENAEGALPAVMYFGGRQPGKATALAQAGSQPSADPCPGRCNSPAPAAMTKVSRADILRQAIELCAGIAHHHQRQQAMNLDRFGKATTVSAGHGQKYFGAARCVEALRMLEKEQA
ncbi:MAG: hypothetical protein GAK30_01546 [Paracidovorax wautersii]|uniref:Nucleoside 2-deoxyribosyltransferase n=1 Tax=Paracidovorax wautersii TaxID=1177982 RepID=A0A7V8FPP0_9BURK|nr:MAG: hypothetical protein GAK30_01546 [Paracidovorax wautersii]